MLPRQRLNYPSHDNAGPELGPVVSFPRYIVMKRIISIIVILLGSASTATPQGTSLADFARRERERRKEMEAAREQLVKEVLQYSSGDMILDQLAKTFSESSEKLFAQVPEDARERLKKSTLESISSSRLFPTFEKTFSKEMDVATLGEVSKWYKTPMGSRIFQVESHPAVRNPEFLKRPVPPGRARLIEELDRQAQSSERTLASIVLMSKAMLTGILSLSGEPPASREAFLKDFERGFRASATAPITAAIRNGILFTYRDLPDSDLEEYIRFLSTPAGQKFANATWKALQASLQQGGADAGAAFGKAVRQMTSVKTP
jgi:hypothetical protein